MKCPKCGYVNSPDAPTCNLCHELLQERVAAAVPQPSDLEPSPLPSKGDGVPYKLVFGGEASLGTAILSGVAGGSFPVPDFGSNCACCGARTSEVCGHLVATADPDASAQEVKVPMCASCKPHAEHHVGSRQVCRGMLAFAIGAILVGIWADTAYPTMWIVGGGLLGVAAAGWYLWNEASRRKLAQQGHHPDLALTAEPGRLTVETRNEALARHLVRANGEILHLVS